MTSEQGRNTKHKGCIIEAKAKNLISRLDSMLIKNTLELILILSIIDKQKTFGKKDSGLEATEEEWDTVVQWKVDLPIK